MNARIQELLKKSTYEVLGVDQVDQTQFAESIIRACAQVSEDDITDGDACCTNTAHRIARQIRKQFGVEE